MEIIHYSVWVLLSSFIMKLFNVPTPVTVPSKVELISSSNVSTPSFSLIVLATSMSAPVTLAVLPVWWMYGGMPRYEALMVLTGGQWVLLGSIAKGRHREVYNGPTLSFGNLSLEALKHCYTV